MSQKIRVALLFGGQSAEHAVSLESAKNVAEALDPKKYDLHLIGIDKKGVWRYVPELKTLTQTDVAKPIHLHEMSSSVFLVPGDHGTEIFDLKAKKKIGDVDVVFPILHGPFGEDGTTQGYLRLLGVPFVGPSVLGSAVGMDKDVMKRLFRDAGLPICDFMVLMKHQTTPADFNRVKDRLGLPFFIKPANMGSSVGVHKVTSPETFASAIADAFLYDFKVLAEENVDGREVECSVLGNREPAASVPGEILPQHAFYSYEAKYLDANGARLKIPAELPEATAAQVREMAVKVFQTLCCEGLSRVDFFLKKDGTLLVNEINTIPGFTKISMYPKMWNACGIGYSELIDRLIQLALERDRDEKTLVRVP